MPEAEESSPRRKAVYLWPNLFTTATLFGGFFAIIAAIRGRFSDAALAIFLAMAADAMDGRVARMTNTQSAFGKEYDSLADMVTFGVASALVMYIWSLQHFGEYMALGGKIGWLIAFAYTACAALRLARFNVHLQRDEDKGFFFGLPSPSAAAVLAGFVWSSDDFGLSGEMLMVPAAIITACAGGLMVSNIRYYSFKDVDLNRPMPFVAVLALIGVWLVVTLDPSRVAFTTFFVYMLSGPVIALWKWRKRRAARGESES